MIGKTLGSYRIIEQIGIGGMATVFKAYAPDTDRYVAIKILPHHFSHDPTFKERFQREAKAIAKLEHLHILPIYSYGEDDGIAYMAMRYLKAGTLTDHIKQGALPLAEADRILRQIASALDHAHSHQILHRDVKPSNVLLDDSGNAFLTDFGIAKMVESTLTGGDILGTPAYMSPEQCQGSTEITAASDIYSLGIVLYEMVTGRAPFQAETPIALIHMQLTESLPLPHNLRSDLPPAAENVILKALAKDPNSRYRTCGEMAIAFSEAVTGPPAAKVPVQAVTPVVPLSSRPKIDEATLLHEPPGKTVVAPKKPPSRRRVWPVAAVVLAGLGILAAGLLFMLLNQDEENGSAPQTISQSEAEEAAPGDLPPERMVEPCHWIGDKPGLCIYPPGDENPIRILEDAGLEIPDAPSWSPDGQKLVFNARKQDTENRTTLHVVNADGTNLTRLQTLSEWDEGPAWSPNGKWLAFISGSGLALMQPEGDGPPTIIVDNDEGAICLNSPEWSPDSNNIVVSAHFGCEWEFPMHSQIWVVAANVDNPEIYPITDIVYDDEECVDFNVAFSPDGERIAYVDEACHPHLINADGSGQAEPIADFPWSWLSNHYPQWQNEVEIQDPEESDLIDIEELLEVYACRDSPRPGSGLCISNVVSGREDETRIVEDEGFETDRFWGETLSPDGQRIAFSAAREREQENHLYITNVGGHELTKLPIGGNSGDPAWSPDGEWLIFHHNGNLARVSPEGRDFSLVLEEATVGCSFKPQWSPAGERFVVSVLPRGCEWIFPMPREIIVASSEGEDRRVIATTNHKLGGCQDFAVAFSPDGGQVAYIDGDCRTYLVTTDGSGKTEPIDEFPWEWTSLFHPQWPQIK